MYAWSRGGGRALCAIAALQPVYVGAVIARLLNPVEPRLPGSSLLRWVVRAAWVAKRETEGHLADKEVMR